MINTESKTIPAVKQSGLIGSYFHTIENEDINWQGLVLSSPEPMYYLCQLFSWMDGSGSLRKLVHIEQMKDWLFYDSNEQMIDAQLIISSKHI